MNALGCLAFLASALFAAWSVLPYILGLMVGLVLFGLARRLWSEWRAPRRFRAAYRSEGRDLLLVTSNSPRWQSYIEENWLPRWGRRAVVLNWSERRKWPRHRASPEIRLYRAFAGSEEVNPLAIVVPAKGGRVRIVRFYQAFRDHHHGRVAALEEREAELEAWLASEQPGAPR